MEMEWHPGSNNQIKRRAVDGQAVDLPNGTQRECDLMVQGSGVLKKNGASLAVGSSRGLLITDPVGGCYEGWNGLPDPIRFQMAVPGASAQSDGLVSTCRVFIDTKNNRVEVDASVPEKGGARTMSVSGLSGKATVVVNGRTVDCSPGSIPLLTKPLEPGEIDGEPAKKGKGKKTQDKPAASTVPTDKAGENPKDKTSSDASDAAKPPTTDASSTLKNPSAKQEWSDRLFRRVKSEVDLHRLVNFRSVMFKSQVKITGCEGDKLMLSVEVPSGGTLSLAWKSLDQAELCEIAVDISRSGGAEESAIAAFYTLLSGQREIGLNLLEKAGAEGQRVKTDLGLP
jgi:hypothetical protein